MNSFIFLASNNSKLNRIGLIKILKLFKITSCIYKTTLANERKKIDLSSSWINGRVFFIKLLFILLVFLFKTFY